MDIDAFKAELVMLLQNLDDYHPKREHIIQIRMRKIHEIYYGSEDCASHEFDIKGS